MVRMLVSVYSLKRTTKHGSRSDFVFMVPPFLAYYGVTTENRSMLEAAYTQISLYRNYLRDPNANNLWKHVVLGSDFNDTGHWSTGNAWAAAGMLRVLTTISGSQYSHLMKNEMKNLKSWINEIHDGMYAHIVSFAHRPLLVFVNTHLNVTAPR